MSFIPLEYYSILYFQFILIVVVAIFFGSMQTELSNENSLRAKKSFGIFLLVSIILYMGLRPISFMFGDMGIYNIEFQNYVNGAPFNEEGEFEFFCSYHSSETGVITAE